MKKFLCVVFAAAMVCTALSAQAAQDSQKKDRDESKWSSISYVDVPVYKILESGDAYVVIYAKNRTGAGSTTIPKKWASGDTENPRKLKFRFVSGQLQPFMTVVQKDNSFLRVILNVPASKGNSFWGIANDAKVGDTDKDKLEDLQL